MASVARIRGRDNDDGRRSHAHAAHMYACMHAHALHLMRREGGGEGCKGLRQAHDARADGEGSGGGEEGQDLLVLMALLLAATRIKESQTQAGGLPVFEERCNRR